MSVTAAEAEPFQMTAELVDVRDVLQVSKEMTGTPERPTRLRFNLCATIPHEQILASKVALLQVFEPSVASTVWSFLWTDAIACHRSLSFAWTRIDHEDVIEITWVLSVGKTELDTRWFVASQYDAEQLNSQYPDELVSLEYKYRGAYLASEGLWARIWDLSGGVKTFKLLEPEHMQMGRRHSLDLSLDWVSDEHGRLQIWVDEVLMQPRLWSDKSLTCEHSFGPSIDFHASAGHRSCCHVRWLGEPCGAVGGLQVLSNIRHGMQTELST